METVDGRIALAHNGELVNAADLRRKILERGVGLSTTSDSELLVQILSMRAEDENVEEEEEEAGPTETVATAENHTVSSFSSSSPGKQPTRRSRRPDWPKRIRRLMQLTPLSYSLLILHEDRIFAARDPFGNRPLCLGVLLSANRRNRLRKYASLNLGRSTT